MEPRRPYGEGWVIFSGFMLCTVGMLDVLNGLYALSHGDTPVKAVVFKHDFEAWGWFYVIAGVILFICGFAVFKRNQVARAIGMLAAIASMVVNMLWIFQYPIASSVVILLSALVLYGLSIYGGRNPVRL